MVLRPYAVVLGGRLERGLEVVVERGVIGEIRASSRQPEPYVLSAAFVNAHSHLEYRGLQGKMREREYWPWIREITEAKRAQDLEGVRADCRLAAEENRRTGIAVIAEHSDRPFAAEAMAATGLGGVVFQEVITRFEPEGPHARVMASLGRAFEQSMAARALGWNIPSYISPHAYQTVDEHTLRGIATAGEPFSMHVAETDLENELTLYGTGVIAETYRRLGVGYSAPGKRLIAILDELGLVRENAQFIHCCALDESEVELLASLHVSVAHCPRSNVALNCPAAPVREMLDSGVPVGLGLDSAASSGPIDMFAEMRCALEVAALREAPLTPEEVWRMATDRGAESLGFAIPDLGAWRIEAGSRTPLIRIDMSDAETIAEVIGTGSPDRVTRLGPEPLPNP
ncbi:MAG TPA: amidohydrolase family protein [Fimbriimonadaceae bacterium]|nr:amidohydrolase family protein [Fimbriimonadaceae bacterium]